MRSIKAFILPFISGIFILMLNACSTTTHMASNENQQYAQTQTVAPKPKPDYASRIPSKIDPPGEKVVVIDPHVHVWGAYNSDGSLVKAGLATAGNSYCPDIHRPCRTKVGSFRVYVLGPPTCKSSIYPLPHGGAPMPYCMFFNKNQAMHGSPPGHVVEGNVSHGCVRLEVADAEWLRLNFVNMGTKVIVKPY